MKPGTLVIAILTLANLCIANELQQQYEKAYYLETAKGQTEEAMALYRKIAGTEATDENRETVLDAMNRLQRYYKSQRATTFAWQQTKPYKPPQFEIFFPNDIEAGEALDALWNASDKDQRSDAEILDTVRNGLRQTTEHRTNIIRWIGNKYIWGKSPQNPYAIEIMYHAADFSGERADPYGTRHYAVYFGLSVTKKKSPAILRTLAELCMRIDDPNDLSRVAWGAKSQQSELISYLQPYLDSDDEAVRSKAKICKRIFEGKLKAFAWAKQKANDKGAIKSSHEKTERRVAEQRSKAKQRMRKDSQYYSRDDLRKIETLYQVANKQWRTQESKDSLEILIEKYDHANRTGCALLYLGQMSSGKDKEEYLKRAIADFSDCFYGDGVQVGAYARYCLAHYYKERGQASKAKDLFEEIANKYPDAINHKGKFLSEDIGRQIGQKQKSALQNKVDGFDMDDGDLKSVIRTFGEPNSYVFGKEHFTKANLPDVYVMLYPGKFTILMKNNRVEEFRFEGSKAYDTGGIQIGVSLGKALEILGQPEKTVRTDKVDWRENILYRTTGGRWKGHAYIAKNGLRLFFKQEVLFALYVTDNTVLRKK